MRFMHTDAMPQTDAPPLTEQAFLRLRSDLNNEEQMHCATIDQRDAAEDCIGDIYAMFTGRAPEWSNLFGYSDAVEELAAFKSPAKSPASESGIGREA